MLLTVESEWRHHRRLQADRFLAGAAVAAEDLLQILDVDIEVVKSGL